VIRLALRDLWSRKLRTILTTLAILLGVAMVSGTYVITDQIDQGFTDIFQKSVQGTDVVVSYKAAFQGQSFATTGTLPASMLSQVQKVPGVLEAAGQVEGSGAVVVSGKVVSTGGAPALVFSTAPARFANTTYSVGAPPTKRGTVSINTKLANDKHLTVGSPIGVTTALGVQNVTVCGVFDWADATSVGGATMVVGTLADVQRWFNMANQYTGISVAAQPGVSPDTLAQRIHDALPAYADVKTGKQSAADGAKAVNDALGAVLRPALLAFGGVALIVGAFIIFNAFSITVAQRLREFAMLRSLGAMRRQVLLSVLGEALLLGLTASLLGLGAGIGIAKGINALFKAVGADIPTSGIVMASRTVIVSLVIGIGVTVVSALMPALRATRVPPVAALQEGATLPPSRLSRFTPYIAGLVAAGGVAFLVSGFVVHATTTQRLLEMGLGVVLLFVAVAMVVKYVVRPLAKAIGWPLAKVFGSSGRLARENAARNPARTAATAAALMIGLAVVVFVAVFAQGLKSSFVDSVDKEVQAPFVISDKQGQTIPASAMNVVYTVPGVANAASVITAPVRVNGKGTTNLFAVDPATFGSMWRFDWIKGGSDQLLSRLRGDSALVEEQFAVSHKLSVGSTFNTLNLQGKRAAFKVIGEYRDPVLATGFVIDQTTYNTLTPPTQRDPFWILANTTPGADQAQVQAGLNAAMRAYPTAQVQTKTQYTDAVKKSVNQLLSMLYALLAVSVIISLFGIVNTLVLTVYERTREIGMLRAIGTTRRQMRRIVRYESVITSVIGGVLGTVLGVLFAYVVTSRVASQGITFSIPWVQLVDFLVVAALVGVVAAVLPARRASRISILEAIHYE
jgi:putative ABC transport system permease protein